VKLAEQAAADPDITGVRSLVTLFEARYYLQGDLEGARTALDRVPAAKRGVHRVLASRLLLAMAERRFDVALQELARVPEAVLLDRVYHGPKALLSGEAHNAAGNAEVAQAQFREAERLLWQELANDPDNLELRAVLALNLTWLARGDEARRELAVVEPLMRGQSFTVYSGQIVALIARCHGVLGDAKAAVGWLRRMLTESMSLPFTPASLRLDPRYARVVEPAEIKALLAEMAAKEPAAGTTASEKTLAVLPFDNRSDEKDAEFFSDGISDELITALQRVPGLTAKGRTSTFFFKGKQVKSNEIGR
jgi:tetratricopeptide (TPR) repeat protein